MIKVISAFWKTDIKVHGKMAKDMELEPFIMLMDLNMKDNGRIISNMVTPFLLMKTEWFFYVSLTMINWSLSKPICQMTRSNSPSYPNLLAKISWLKIHQWFNLSITWFWEITKIFYNFIDIKSNMITGRKNWITALF